MEHKCDHQGKDCVRKVLRTESWSILNLGDKKYSAKETKKEDHTSLELSLLPGEINR